MRFRKRGFPPQRPGGDGNRQPFRQPLQPAAQVLRVMPTPWAGIDHPVRLAATSRAAAFLHMYGVGAVTLCAATGRVISGGSGTSSFHHVSGDPRQSQGPASGRFFKFS